MPYSPTTWVNGSSPFINQTNLRKLRDELASQASARSISHTLPVWTDGAAPFITDAAPWQEMERVARLVAASLGIGEYEETRWFPGWDPPRNAANLNKLELQAQENRSAMDNINPNYPSTFYTGPLGAGNILPTYGRAFLGSMFGGVNYSWAQERQQVADRQTQIGRIYDIVQMHYDGGGTWGGVFGSEDPTADSPQKIQFAIDNGSIPMIVWTPDFSVPDMLLGAADEIWTKMADYMKTFAPVKIMLRAFNEFDGGGAGASGSHPLYKWGSTAYSSTDFHTVWQHMVSIFQSRGATNVGFMYCTNEGGVFEGSPTHNRTLVAQYYPGDAYVDWVGSDWYNRAPRAQSVWYKTTWTKGWELFNYGIATDENTNLQLWSGLDILSRGTAVSGQRSWTGTPRQKPFFVGETATEWIAADAEKKRTWWSEWVTSQYGLESMIPYLIGVSFYDQDVSAVEGLPIGNYRVDWYGNESDLTSFDATTRADFVTMANDPLFDGRA